MCTLSWKLTPEGYELFFNRDEQCNRIKAKPPSFFHNNNSMMPIDPVANGTWIAVNKWGISLCLLNLYQQSVDIKNERNLAPISRGLIIPELIQYKKSDDIIKILKQTDLKIYQPFSLCIFSEKLNLKQPEVLIYQWDGKQLLNKNSSQNKLQAPIISSSVAFEQVVDERTKTYHNIIKYGDKLSKNQHIDYHSSHKPERGYLSVCMHRDDAQTQSLSVIKVAKQIDFSYSNGPPCDNKLNKYLTFKKKI